MSRPKGLPKSGGRTKGTPNKATVERNTMIAQYFASLNIEMFPGDAVDFLQYVYKNQALPPGMRIDAAKAAAPYERAKPLPELRSDDPVQVVLQDLRRPNFAIALSPIREAQTVPKDDAPDAAIEAVQAPYVHPIDHTGPDDDEQDPYRSTG